jgi:hypothetical protein
MSHRRKKTRKISPSDDELVSEISAVLESNGADSAASALGIYAIYTRLRADKKDWMLSPMRISVIIENLVNKNLLTKISEDDRRYFCSKKGAHVK